MIIRKIISILITATFLYQNTAFGVLEKTFTLRPPSQFNKATREIIGKSQEKIPSLVERLSEGELKDSEINELSAKELAGILSSVKLKEYNLEQKMLLYSAAPGTGKEDVMRLAFKGDKKDVNNKTMPAPYEKFTEKLILYHTRGFRADEIDGKAYHFGNTDVGNPDKNRLLKNEREGTVKTANVNKQLQGVALKEFDEMVEIPANDGHRMILLGDTILEQTVGKTVVKRKIGGLKEVFNRPALTVLEGGYAWFKAFTEESPDIFTIFLASLTPEEIRLRGKNQEIISETYAEPFERLVACSLLNMIRNDLKIEKIDLRDEKTLKRLKDDVEKWINDYREGKAEEKVLVERLGRHENNKIDIMKVNAGIIESDEFIENELNYSLKRYFNHGPIDLKSDAAYIARAFAYELQMKISNDVKRGDTSFEIEVPEHETEHLGDFTKPQDMFNRVIEGIVQIMLMEEYQGGDRKGKGSVVLDKFLLGLGTFKEKADRQKEIDRYVSIVAEQFCQRYFSYLVRAINERNFLKNKYGIKDEGTVAKSRFSGIGSIGGTILDPDNKDGIWEEDSPTEVRLKPNTNLTKKTVREIVKGDFDKVWAILQQSLEAYSRYNFLKTTYFGGNKEEFIKAIESWLQEYKQNLGEDISVSDLLVKEFFLITDENGAYVKDQKGNYRISTRDLCHKNKTWHRTVGMLVIDRNGKVLIQTRAKEKISMPLARDVSAGGHQGLDIYPEKAAIKEIQEELFNETHIIDPSRLVRITPEGHFIKNNTGKENATFFAYFINDSEKEKIELQPEELVVPSNREELFVNLKDEIGQYDQVKNDPKQDKYAIGFLFFNTAGEHLSSLEKMIANPKGSRIDLAQKSILGRVHEYFKTNTESLISTILQKCKTEDEKLEIIEFLAASPEFKRILEAEAWNYYSKDRESIIGNLNNIIELKQVNLGNIKSAIEELSKVKSGANASWMRWSDVLRFVKDFFDTEGVTEGNLTKKIEEAGKLLESSRRLASYINKLIDDKKIVPPILEAMAVKAYEVENQSIAARRIKSVAPDNAKYDTNGKVKPFEGVTVVANLKQDSEFTKFVKAVIGDVDSYVAKDLESVNKWQKGKNFIGTVAIGSEHVTLYDAVCQGDDWISKYETQLNEPTKKAIEQEMKDTGKTREEAVYSVVERRIISALQDFRASKVPVFKPVGTAAFKPGGDGVTVFIINVVPKSAEDLEVVTRLQDRIKEATGINNFGEGEFKGHITIGYFINPLEKTDLDEFKDYIDRLDKYIKDRSDELAFELPLIEVSGFANMDSFPPVEGGSFQWLASNQAIKERVEVAMETFNSFLGSKVFHGSFDYGKLSSSQLDTIRSIIKDLGSIDHKDSLVALKEIKKHLIEISHTGIFSDYVLLHNELFALAKEALTKRERAENEKTYTEEERFYQEKWNKIFETSNEKLTVSYDGWFYDGQEYWIGISAAAKEHSPFEDISAHHSPKDTMEDQHYVEFRIKDVEQLNVQDGDKLVFKMRYPERYFVSEYEIIVSVESGRFKMYLDKDLNNLTNTLNESVELLFVGKYLDSKRMSFRTALSSLSITPILFLDAEAVKNSKDFEKALEQLKINEGNIPVVLLTEETKESIMAKLSGIDLTGVQFRTKAELGLQDLDWGKDERVNLIDGIDSLKCIPLTSALYETYKDLQKVRDQV